jgi:hypothetical protein
MNVIIIVIIIFQALLTVLFVFGLVAVLREQHATHHALNSRLDQLIEVERFKADSEGYKRRSNEDRGSDSLKENC